MTEPKRKETKVVDTLHLEVHPSVVFKLGADLITDDMQALIELIKNSYDADATYVRVYIDTHSRFHPITGELLDDKDVDTVAAVADREGVDQRMRIAAMRPVSWRIAIFSVLLR